MPMFRSLRSQARISLLSGGGIISFLLIYLWFIHNKEYYRSSQIAHERCASELSSVRYQLEVVSEYKKKMDWLLTETQKEHQEEKSQLKEMMDNYAALKHHLYVCEDQSEDLEKECQNLKEELIKARRELKELQNVKQELEKCQKPAS